MKLLGKSDGKPFLVALIVYLLLIFGLSHIPGSAWQTLNLKFWDKLMHFLEYVPVGILLSAWLLKGYLKRIKTVYSVLILFSVIAAAGTGDELHQYFVPGREATMGDVLADTLGGGTGVICTILILRWKRPMQGGELGSG